MALFCCDLYAHELIVVLVTLIRLSPKISRLRCYSLARNYTSRPVDRSGEIFGLDPIQIGEVLHRRASGKLSKSIFVNVLRKASYKSKDFQGTLLFALKDNRDNTRRQRV